MTLSRELYGYQLALPESLDLPRDKLKVRLDFYGSTVMMFAIDNDVVNTKMVDAREIALALLREIPLGSGILPENTLWWRQGVGGAEVALWRERQVWPTALQVEAFKPPVRYQLPMPGLIFICRPGSPPRVFAAKKRPLSLKDKLYHAPLFNVFSDGTTCPGSHRYPEDIADIPSSFFMSFFTATADWEKRSKKYPNSLINLWEEINGKRRYPLGDLVYFGKVEEVI